MTQCPINCVDKACLPCNSLAGLKSSLANGGCYSFNSAPTMKRNTRPWVFVQREGQRFFSGWWCAVDISNKRARIQFASGTNEWLKWPASDSVVFPVSHDDYKKHIDGEVLWPSVGREVQVLWDIEKTSAPRKWTPTRFYRGVVSTVRKSSIVITYDDGSSTVHSYPNSKMTIVFKPERKKRKEWEEEERDLEEERIVEKESDTCEVCEKFVKDGRGSVICANDSCSSSYHSRCLTSLPATERAAALEGIATEDWTCPLCRSAMGIEDCGNVTQNVTLKEFRRGRIPLPLHWEYGWFKGNMIDWKDEDDDEAIATQCWRGGGITVKAGQEAEVNWNQSGVFYPCTIKSINARSQKLNVEYVDSDKENGVGREFVRVLLTKEERKKVYRNRKQVKAKWLEREVEGERETEREREKKSDKKKKRLEKEKEKDKPKNIGRFQQLTEAASNYNYNNYDYNMYNYNYNYNYSNTSFNHNFDIDIDIPQTDFIGVFKRGNNFLAKMSVGNCQLVIGACKDPISAALIYDDVAFDMLGGDYCNFTFHGYGSKLDGSRKRVRGGDSFFDDKSLLMDIADELKCNERPHIGVTKILLRQGEQKKGEGEGTHKIFWQTKIATRSLGNYFVNTNYNFSIKHSASSDDYILNLGIFENVSDACNAYDSACTRIRGDFAILNKPIDSL